MYIYLYINICSNRLLLPSNPYTPPQEKTVITEIVITVIQIIFKNPWLFQKHFVPFIGTVTPNHILCWWIVFFLGS